MKETFYTGVYVYGSKILYTGIENGKKVKSRVDYHPTLFLPTNKKTKYKNLQGEYLASVQPGTIRDCRDFVEKYKHIDNFKIYGNQKYEYAYIHDHFKEEIHWNKSLIHIMNMDIEVASDNGFPDPIIASNEITAITIKDHRGFQVFGCKDFNNARKDVKYIRCLDEIDLIRSFLSFWVSNYPDILTGWNTNFFDIPYLVNRITNVLGNEYARKLSPWGVLKERKTFIMGKEQTTYIPLGVSSLDYIDLYKKFSPGGASQESYKLDNICHVELGERKLSYEEYGNLHNLYKENYQKFLEYNIRDVELVEKLDEKLKLIDLALTLAYDSKTNYEDVFSQVRMWDSIIYNHLMNKNIVIPPKQVNEKNEAFVGAYVKDPQIGLHEWIASFDLNSLYPHLVIQYNISPDTFIEPTEWNDDMKNIIQQGVSIDSLLTMKVKTDDLKKHSVTLTPNGQFFRTDKQGFLSELMETMYEDRTRYKKLMIESRKTLEKETDKQKRKILENDIAKYNNLQMVKKICLNSAYGSIGNPYFRFFDVRQASAITTAGQLSIRWIENELNDYMNKLLKTDGVDYCIASDTDSIYLKMKELIEKTILHKNPDADTKEIIQYMDKACELIIQPFIDSSYDKLYKYLNSYAQKMIMKREALSDKGIWTAKKRYVLNVHNNEGVEYSKPKLKVMGLEIIKSSTPTSCRGKLKEAINVIMNQSEKEIIEFIEEYKKQFHDLSLEEISFPRGVNGITKYSDSNSLYRKGTPIHVRGSIIYNNMLKKMNLENKYPKINNGDKIRFIYLKEPNTIKSNVLSFPQTIPPEFGIDSYIDYNLQFEKSFLEPLKTILDAIEWRHEKKNSLENFFT